MNRRSTKTAKRTKAAAAPEVDKAQAFADRLNAAMDRVWGEKKTVKLIQLRLMCLLMQKNEILRIAAEVATREIDVEICETKRCLADAELALALNRSKKQGASS